MTQYSDLVVEECAGISNKCETQYEGMAHDDFYTPPPTPCFAPDFRTTVQFQFEMLQAFVMTQYEKDLSEMRQEIEGLRQRLFAYESTGVPVTLPQNVMHEALRGSCELSAQIMNSMPITSSGRALKHVECMQEPTEILGSDELDDKISLAEQLPGSKSENKRQAAATGSATEISLNFSCTNAEGGNSSSDDPQHSGLSVPLDHFPVAASSQNQAFDSTEPMAVQADMSSVAPDAPSSASAISAPPAKLEANFEGVDIKDMTGSSVAQVVDPDSRPGCAADPAQENMPLLGIKSTEVIQCELQEGTRLSPGRVEAEEPVNTFSRSSIPTTPTVKTEMLAAVADHARGSGLLKMMRSTYESSMTKQLYNPDREKPEKLHLRLKSHSFLSNSFQEDRSSLQKLVMSTKFDLFTGGLIVANAICFAFSIQHDGFDCGHAVQPKAYMSAADEWPGGSVVFLVFECLFSILFVLELLLRLIAYGPSIAIRSMWMWFDFCVIVLGVIDTFGAGALGINTSMIRLFRLVRLVRLLKIFQALQAFDSLFLLVKAVQASVNAMAYSFLMLVLLQVVVGMFMCQMLQPRILNDDLDLTVRQDLFKYFGTFSRAMLSMFEITLANWVPACRLLVEEVHELWMLFFILYRCMFCFALLKVISAVFITETNRVLQNDDELFLMRAKRDKESYTAKLGNMFRKIDLDGDGYLSWDELQQLLSNTASAEYLTTLGFQQHDFEKLFWLIDDGGGKIPINDFVSKVGKLKGESKSIDTLTLLKLAHRIEMLVHTAFVKQGLVKQDDGEDSAEVDKFTKEP